MPPGCFLGQVLQTYPMSRDSGRIISLCWFQGKGSLGPTTRPGEEAGNGWIVTFNQLPGERVYNSPV